MRNQILALGLVLTRLGVPAVAALAVPLSVTFGGPFVGPCAGQTLDGDANLFLHDIPSTFGFGIENGERAYSTGAVWCNLSDAPLSWNGSNAAHPISVHNLFRIEQGAIRHLGASWVSHQFCALQTAACSTCTPAGTGCPPLLGAGCSTSSTANSLATQAQMSRRSEVNASTGSFSFPFAVGAPSGPVERRCRVAITEVDPALHPGATFVMEIVSIHPSAGDPNARCATRDLHPSSMLGSPLPLGPTSSGSTAIERWAALEPTVALRTIDLPNDGRVLVGCNVIAEADGSYRYEYAIANLNSHESIGSVSIPLSTGTTVIATSSHLPAPHSGEVTSGEPWSVTVAADAVRHATEPFATNPDANAIRWATVGIVTLVTDRPPVEGSIELGTFRSNGSILVSLPVPGPAPTLVGDIDGDGSVGSGDLAVLLGAWGPCRGCAADLDGNGAVEAADLALLLGVWNAAGDA
jgi:hypothetical protein